MEIQNSGNHREYANFWRRPALNGLELMKAEFITHSFPRHMHDTYVIGIIEDGIEEFYCEGTDHTAPPGSIILVNPGEVHTGHPGKGTIWKYRSMYPSIDLMLKAARQLGIGNSEVPYFPKPVVQDRALAQEIHHLHCLLEGGGEELAAQSFFLLTMSELIARHSNRNIVPAAVRSDHTAVGMVKAYILENLAQNISLKVLAKVAGLSPFHLLRLFRKEVGLPPHEFLINARIEKARELLYSGWSIAQTAYETGFADQSHFTRHFKRAMGVTPKKYVRQQGIAPSCNAFSVS